MDRQAIPTRPVRVSSACERCRRRKIRCSGSHPCTNCTRRNFECHFGEEGRRVVVSQKYLHQLQRAANATASATARTSDDDSSQPLDDSIRVVPSDSGNMLGPEQNPSPFRTPVPALSGDAAVEASNPLASTTTSYVADEGGRMRALGESSTWSFSRKTLMLLRDQLGPTVAPEISLNEESSAYGLSWGPSNFEDASNFNDLPSIDYAIYLLNGVKFHVGQLFHLFDETEFMCHFHEFYESPAEKTKTSKIWYSQFLALLALGKVVVISPSKGPTTLPGSDLFIRAMSLLPDPSYLFKDALTAIETLCIIAIYLQTADMRNSAFIYIGQALRMALTFALHRKRPERGWDPAISDRCYRVWWTVYILDHSFSSSMGVPTSIQWSDITTPMPDRQGSPKSTALFIHVRLSSLISQVVNKIYGAEGRLQSTFLPSVHGILGDIASIAGDIDECFLLSFSGSGGGISRVAAHLQLLYHQTILLTMYPLLLYLFEVKLKGDTSNGSVTPRTFSDTTQAMLQRCGDSCKTMIRILAVLRQQNLLESSLPFDLERAFSSSFVSIMLSIIIPSVTDYETVQLESNLIFDEIISSGCIPARFRKSELTHLRAMIHLWESSLHGPQNLEDPDTIHVGQFQETNAPQGNEVEHLLVEHGLSEVESLSPAQILALARMVDDRQEMVDLQQGMVNDDMEWMNRWLWEDGGNQESREG